MPSASRPFVKAIALLLALAPASAQADPMIYSTGGVGTDLLAIDAKTGESKVVGSFGYPGSAPLAFGTDGKLYTVTDSMRHENASRSWRPSIRTPARQPPLAIHSIRPSASWLWGPGLTEACMPAE